MGQLSKRRKLFYETCSESKDKEMSQRRPQRSQSTASARRATHGRIVVALDLPSGLSCRATVKADDPDTATVHFKVDKAARPAPRRR